MTVRLWLGVADCWQCGTSIELTEEQERDLQLMLRHGKVTSRPDIVSSAETRPSAPAPSAATPTAPTTAPPEPAPEPAHSPPLSDDSASLTPSRPVEQRPRAAAVSVPRMRPRQVPSDRPISTARRATRLFDSFPAWLISVVLHLILLTLLALWHLGEVEEEQRILLSTAIVPDQIEGGEVAVVLPDHELAFDLPLPQDLDLSDRKVREAVIRADQDARQLRLDPGVDEPDLPSLESVKAVIGGGGGRGPGRPLAARDPRIRTDVVRQEGGTTMTEAAVARGLLWLAEHQEEDGSWSLDRFNHRLGCSCGGTGSMHSDAAATYLALLPFLGAGQTHLVGRYQHHVSQGLRWTLAHQRDDGDLRGTSTGNAGMYAQGQGAIVLCEAYMMTGDETLRPPAQRAVQFIVAAQHIAGGWRYAPGQPGDTSVLGWQLMALQSARAAGLKVPEETLELAGQYLDSVSERGGSLYSYMPGQAPTHVMTAEALLCRMYLGWTLDSPALRDGIEYLVDRHLPRSRSPNIYYWYYATQSLHHAGGKPWETWNAHMREVLVESQERRGHAAGSWSPRGEHASAGGRIYMTSLAVCSLEVYYRHLPLFRQLDLK
ncbi:MAG: prenyltransferase/squalene oxidase repeat-containing protein [Pirellulaceae bacterium]